jgi:hypothetical protein
MSNGNSTCDVELIAIWQHAEKFQATVSHPNKHQSNEHQNEFYKIQTMASILNLKFNMDSEQQ